MGESGSEKSQCKTRKRKYREKKWRENIATT